MENPYFYSVLEFYFLKSYKCELGGPCVVAMDLLYVKEMNLGPVPLVPEPFGAIWDQWHWSQHPRFSLGEMTFLDNFEFFWTKTLKILSGVVGTFVQYLGGPEELDGKSSVFG